MPEYFVKRPGEEKLVITNQMQEGDILASEAEIAAYYAHDAEE